MREEVYNFPTAYSTQTTISSASLDPYYTGKGFLSGMLWSLGPGKTVSGSHLHWHQPV